MFLGIADSGLGCRGSLTRSVVFLGVIGGIAKGEQADRPKACPDFPCISGHFDRALPTLERESEASFVEVLGPRRSRSSGPRRAWVTRADCRSAGSNRPWRAPEAIYLRV